MKQKITIFGSTGSIGTQTLAVLAKHPDQFSVHALAANRNVELLFQQCLQFKPKYAALVNQQAAALLSNMIQNAKLATEVLVGEQALIDLAKDHECDTVMAAIVGAAGLRSTFVAIESGKRVLLANKEALVMSGSLFVDAVKKYHAILLPVDSEHSAILQCLSTEFRPGYSTSELISSIVLTASGGAFRHLPLDQLETVAPHLAVAHPNWNMGPKITVDCATMINKGLEMIEARWLFNLHPRQIEAIIHPQSIIHSFVNFKDGSTMAQLGLPDMRVPISCALAWPQRIESGVQTLSLIQVKQLDFSEIDLNRYPCFKIALEVLRMDNMASVIMNAANEVAVDAFLKGVIRFTDIPRLIASILEQCEINSTQNIDHVLATDEMVRHYSHQWVKNHTTLVGSFLTVTTV